jgi:hypothetical protein
MIFAIIFSIGIVVAGIDNCYNKYIEERDNAENMNNLNERYIKTPPLTPPNSPKPILITPMSFQRGRTLNRQARRPRSISDSDRRYTHHSIIL